MPVNYRNYHPAWKDVIRPAVLKRDDYKCAICRAPNKKRIIRTQNDNWLEVDPIIEKECEKTGQKITKVILTVAHLNHLTTDNRMSNLKAMCQLHHIRHDKTHKAEMRRIANIWSPQKVIDMCSKPGGEVYLNHLLVIARARRNQLRQLEIIRKKRAHYGTYSQYDKDLLTLAIKTQTEFYALVKAGCKILSKAFEIDRPTEFFRAYWEADNVVIADRYVVK